MANIALTLTVVVLAVVVLSVDSAPRCSPSGNEISAPLESCEFGIVKNYCGRETCAKGPGQRCGGKRNYHGTCGDGLICSCHRCTGCSLKTLQCFSDPCI